MNRYRSPHTRSSEIIGRARSYGLRSAALFVLILPAACEAPGTAAATAVVRDSLPNGVVRLSYPALPAPEGGPVEPDLRIGVMDGPLHEVFGDVRAIEADDEGTIYILDHLASEIRAFTPDGEYLRTLTRSGDGPGELTAANGMVFSPDGVLWVQDHGKWQMIGLRPDGEEVERFPMHVLNYGYVWNGALDDLGRFWKPTSHSDDERVFPPEEGLQEGSSRGYMNWFDPASKATDSVFLGESSYRTFVSRNSMGGYSYRGIPFTARSILIVDPAGGFWAASGEDYSIVHLDEQADTTLVIEVDAERLAVTREDRENFIAEAVERDADGRRAAEALVALAPERKPALNQLFVDDEGRLWVGLVRDEGDEPRFDVFTRQGDYVGSVHLGFQPSPYQAPRIRNGMLYGTVTDSLDVPTVVRARLPDFRGPEHD